MVPGGRGRGFGAGGSRGRWSFAAPRFRKNSTFAGLSVARTSSSASLTSSGDMAATLRPASSVGMIGRAVAGGGGRSARGVGVQRRVGKPPPPGGGRGGALLRVDGVLSLTPETTISSAVLVLRRRVGRGGSERVGAL